ncbi:MAG: glycosyltransferase [Verrucomicrobiae bacterium]|nr:glycosyltransferase [Verrucomicrobiae bacterium]
MGGKVTTLELEPLVTVILTTYNSERYLAETLDSLIAQTYDNMEIVVVDNLSVDKTEKIVKGYGEAIKFRKADRPCMLAEARNLGISETNGKYIAFLDSDDTWYPQKIAKQVAFMEAHPEVPLCHTYCHVIDAHSVVQYVRHEGNLPGTGTSYHKLLRHNFITISSAMVRRSVLDQIGITFPCDPQRDTTGEDNLFFLLLARKHPVGLVDEVLCTYRIHGDSACDRFGWKIRPENVLVSRNILHSPRYWRGIAERAEVRDALIEACWTNCIYWRDRGHWKRALYFVLVGLQEAPAARQMWGQLLKSLGKSCLSLFRKGVPVHG